jgi:flagellar basal body rod protein FlgG
LEDYLSRADDPAAFKGAQVLANMLYGLDNDYEKNLPENKFLIKYKFVNDSLRFINKDGKLTDKDGRLVDEDGRYINDKGEYIDKDGNRIDVDGNFLIDHQPFLDDDGNPILEDTTSTTNEKSVDAPAEQKDSE